MSEPVKQADPGVREFAHFIKLVDDGEAHDDLTNEVEKLLNTLRDDAESRGNSGVSKGRITLTLDFAVEAKGVCGVTYDIGTKEPKKNRAGSLFWLTKNNRITNKNPKQQDLFGPREVPREGPAREAPAAEVPARSI